MLEQIAYKERFGDRSGVYSFLRGRGRVAVNIGGIANLTAIPPNTSTDRVIAFDTGPGNMVIDQLISRISQGGQTYDGDGVVAASGSPDPKLLAKLLRDKYFRQAAQDGRA